MCVEIVRRCTFVNVLCAGDKARLYSLTRNNNPWCNFSRKIIRWRVAVRCPVPQKTPFRKQKSLPICTTNHPERKRSTKKRHEKESDPRYAIPCKSPFIPFTARMHIPSRAPNFSHLVIPYSWLSNIIVEHVYIRWCRGVRPGL